MIFAVFDVLLDVNMCINYSFFYIYKGKGLDICDSTASTVNEHCTIFEGAADLYEKMVL